MPIFYTNTASLNLLEVSSSAVISSSRGNTLKVIGSGSSIFSVTGSTGVLAEFSDVNIGDSNILVFSSASVDIFTINKSKVVSISGSLIVTGSITGSLFGSSSFATTASYALNAASANSFPYTGSAIISGSLRVTGSVSIDYTNIVGDGFSVREGPGSFRLLVVSGSPGLNEYVKIGDVDEANTGTSLTVDGATEKVTVKGEFVALTGIRVDQFGITVSSGNVAIGTSAPSASLHVQGGIVAASGSGIFLASLTASEALTAGDYINIATGGVRKASSTDITKQAHGFVNSAYSSGNQVVVYQSGINFNVTGLSIGSRYFLSSSGQESTSPPTQTGSLSQEIGVAVSATAILVNLGPAIIT